MNVNEIQLFQLDEGIYSIKNKNKTSKMRSTEKQSGHRHNLAVLSPLPEASSEPAGLQAQMNTSLLCPFNKVTSQALISDVEGGSSASMGSGSGVRGVCVRRQNEEKRIAKL